MFHKHNWNLIDKTIIEDFSTKVLNNPRLTHFENMWPGKDKVVLTFKCNCGKVKVIQK